MGALGSLEVETPSHRPQNPYIAHGSSTSNARLYFMLCLAFFVIYSLFSIMGPSESYSSVGDAAGGWGREHNHVIEHHDTSLITPQQRESSNTYTYPSVDLSKFNTNNEFLEEDFMIALEPLITIPSHPRSEYQQYQTDGLGFDTAKLLADTNTPHGMAYDFIVNRDKRNLKPEDPQLIQRYVLTLLFFATGGHDENDPSDTHTRHGGWEADMAHFLTGLHECHWVKKGLGDQLWEILSMESDDGKVGVTKCNDEMEVTEIRLGMQMICL